MLKASGVPNGFGDTGVLSANVECHRSQNHNGRRCCGPRYENELAPSPMATFYRRERLRNERAELLQIRLEVFIIKSWHRNSPSRTWSRVAWQVHSGIAMPPCSC